MALDILISGKSSFLQTHTCVRARLELLNLPMNTKREKKIFTWIQCAALNPEGALTRFSCLQQWSSRQQSWLWFCKVVYSLSALNNTIIHLDFHYFGSMYFSTHWIQRDKFHVLSVKSVKYPKYCACLAHSEVLNVVFEWSNGCREQSIAAFTVPLPMTFPDGHMKGFTHGWFTFYTGHTALICLISLKAELIPFGLTLNGLFIWSQKPEGCWGLFM